jgi:hypothetical protein
MPAGRYRVSFHLLSDWQIMNPLEKSSSVPVGLEILSPPNPPVFPLEIDPADCPWLNLYRVYSINWLGRAGSRMQLATKSQLWVCPRLPAGDYELAITAKAHAVGDDPKTRWPNVGILQPGRQQPLEMRFDSTYDQTLRQRIHVNDPQDFFKLMLLNPECRAANQSFIIFYFDEAPRSIWESRGVTFDKIRIHPLGGQSGSTPINR